MMQSPDDAWQDHLQAENQEQKLQQKRSELDNKLRLLEQETKILESDAESLHKAATGRTAALEEAHNNVGNLDRTIAVRLRIM